MTKNCTQLLSTMVGNFLPDGGSVAGAGGHTFLDWIWVLYRLKIIIKIFDELLPDNRI